MPVIRLPDGTPIEFPAGMDPEVARRLAVAQFAGKHGLKKETATQGSNILSAGIAGVANTLGIVPGLTGAITGDYENAPLSGVVKRMREYAREKETPEVTYKKYLIDQAIAKASREGGVSGEAVETLKQLAINPSVTALKLVELIPDIVAAVGTGGIGSLAGKAAVKALTKGAGEEALKKGAARGAATGAVGTSALQEGTATGQEVYEEVLRLELARKTPPDEARRRAVSAARAATAKQAATTAALGAILPGAEKSLLGVGRGGAFRTALGEAAEEGGTGIAGQLYQNIAAGEVDPSIALSRGVGRAGTEGAVLGGLAGAGSGAVSRAFRTPETAPAPEADPTKEVTDTAIQTAQDNGDVTPEEVEQADATARIADIAAKARTAKEAADKAAAEAAEAEKKAAEEDKLPDEVETTEPTAPSTVATAPTEGAPAQTAEGQIVPSTTEDVTRTTTDGTQTTQAQQAEEKGPEAPSADAAATTSGTTATEVDQNAPTGTVAEGSGVGVSVAGEPGGGTGAGRVETPATEGLGEAGVGTGGPAGGEGGKPPSLKVPAVPTQFRGQRYPSQAPALTEEQEKARAEKAAADAAKAAEEKAKAKAEADKRAAEQKAEEEALAAEPEEAPGPTAFEDLDLKQIEAEAARVKAAPTAPKAKEKITTRADLRKFDAEIPVDQAALETKLAEVRKIPSSKLTAPQRAIRWYGAYVEANGGTLADIPRYLAHNIADPTFATTGFPKRFIKPSLTWLNSNLGGKVGNDVNVAAAKIQTRIEELADLQRRQSEAGLDAKKGKSKAKKVEAGEARAENVDGLVKLLAERNSKNKVYSLILSRLSDVGLKTRLVFDGEVEGGKPAKFDPRDGVDGTITFAKDGFTDEVALHELVHAAVDHNIDNPKKLSDAQKLALSKLKSLYEVAKEKFGEDYEIGNLKEFVAEAMSNPLFQRDLQKVNVPVKGFGNFVRSLARAIAELLGISPASNLFAQTLDNVEALLSAPTASRRGKEVSYAPAEAKKIKIGGKEIEIEAKVTEPAVGTKKEKSEKQKAREAVEAERIKNLIDITLSKKDKAVRFAQNAQRPILLLEEALRKKGELTPDYELNVAVTLQGSASDALAKQTVDPIIHEYQNVLEDIAKKSGVDLDEVLAQMDRYYAAMTSIERRLSKFFERAKLSDAGTRRREVLFRAIVADKAELAKIKKDVVAADADLLGLIPDEMTPAKARALYKKIEETVLTDDVGRLQDINSSQFQVAAIRTDDGSEIDLDVDLANKIISEMDAYLGKNPEIKKLYGEARRLQKDLEKVTLELNREANYGSPQLDMLMQARGWRNYVPLRGAPTKYQPEDTFEKYDPEPPVTGALVQTETKMKGRTTAAENAVFRSFAEATRAATRPSRTEVTQIIKNLVEKGYVAGSINKPENARKEKGPSTFLERFIENKKLPREDNVVYHYGPDGKVDVIRIDNKDLARAIREVYQNSNPYIDRLNAVTSFVGRGFTRYNPSFWAKNFVVDIMTNSFVFAAEHGKASKYLWQVASDLVDNKGTAKAMNFIRLYEKGDKASIAALNKLAEKDSWYKDALEYVNIGGKVSQMSGLSTKKQEEATYNRLGPNRVVRTLKQFDSLITPITDGLELAARVSAFRTARTIPDFKNNKRGAVAYAKNLANFENIGLQGRTLGALFMFFRPSATGAVRALDALMKGKHGKRTAILALGMGYTIAALSHLLSGDDEEGRNRMEIDNPDRWVRNWRIHLPGTENPIQSSWGFGIGTIASVGAQLWMLFHGRNGVGDFLSNSQAALREGFLPLPFSQINFFEKPVQAFLDSIAPSVVRPLLQYGLNIDSLNREIFNSTVSRYSPAYLSKENVPETINQFSRALFDAYTMATGSPPSKEVQQIISPTGIGFFMNNYLSAIYKIGTTLDDTVRYAMFDGQKTPDAVKASMVLAGFKGTSVNYDFEQFDEIRKQIKKYESAIKTYERSGNEAKMDEYLDKYPEREDAVKVLNKFEGGELKKLQAERNKILAELADKPAERQEALKQNRKEQNEVMREMTLELKEILAR